MRGVLSGIPITYHIKLTNMKVAKLVLISLMTRVIVEDTDTNEQVAAKALPQFKHILEVDGMENIEDIYEDEEVPFGTFDDDNATTSPHK